MKYYCVWSHTKQCVELVTYDIVGLNRFIDDSDYLIKLKQSPHQWVKNLITNEELCFIQFDDDMLSNKGELFYQINEQGLIHIVTQHHKDELNTLIFNIDQHVLHYA